MSQVTIAPLDEQVGLWTVDKRAGNDWHWRSVVVQLPGGGVAVFSPTRGTGDAVQSVLEELGGVRVLVAPNHFHYLGLPEWRERYPEAAVVASELAAARIRRKLEMEIQPLGALTEQLPEDVSVLEPPGTRSGEIWLRAKTSYGTTWIVCDAFFNLAGHPAGFMGVACRALGVTSGLRIGATFTTLALRDRRAYRDWMLERLERDRPRLLIPCHGEVLESDELTDRLSALARARLR